MPRVTSDIVVEVWGLGSEDQFRVQGSGCRVQGSGPRVSGFQGSSWMIDV